MQVLHITRKKKPRFFALVNQSTIYIFFIHNNRITFDIAYYYIDYYGKTEDCRNAITYSNISLHLTY